MKAAAGFNGRMTRDARDSRPDVAVRPVKAGQWEVVAWLWQAFRHDLAGIVDGLPYSDGRYQAGPLQQLPSPDGAGYLAWRPHPNTGQDAPVGFALVTGLQHPRRSMLGFWIAPVVRREGLGRAFAGDVLRRHPGPWSIGFQHRNAQAGLFWRDVANRTFGPHGWTEVQRPVPGLPDVPPDHFIETTGCGSATDTASRARPASRVRNAR